MSLVETRTVQPVPAGERHGKAWRLAGVFAAPNLNVVAIVTGALAVQIGLSFWWAVVAVVAGTAVAAVFMAFHATQGPKLGLPQLIQSRAQFGSAGNALPSLVTLVDTIGFGALAFIVAGESLRLEFRTLPMTWAIVIAGVVTAVIAMVGYDLIQRVQQWLTLLLGALCVIWTWRALTMHAAGPAPVSHTTVGAFLLAVSFAASFTIAWAPYVADYSRYLPESTSPAKVFWYSYAGTALSSVWMEILGAGLAVLAAKAFAANAVSFLAGLTPGGVTVPLVIVLLLAQVSPGVMNSYSPACIAANLLQPFGAARWLLSRAGRLFLVGAATAIAVGAAVYAEHAASFDTNMTNFLLFLIYILAPWTAINLTDFYLVRRGRYDVGELMKANGAYGLLNVPTVVIYLAAVGLEFLFMNSALFVGPVSTALGGADLAWIVGVVVAGGGYWLASRVRVISPVAEGA